MMFFYFLKIIFDISTSKRSKKYKPHSILAKKKKKFKFERNTGTNSIPNIPLIKNQNPKYIGNFNYDPRPPLKKKIKNK
jgi:hypothetical protein